MSGKERTCFCCGMRRWPLKRKTPETFRSLASSRVILQFIRIMHRPVSLSFRLQVTLLPDTSRSTRFASLGCPIPRALWPRGRPILGFPLVSAFQLCRRSTFELPRISDASALHRLIKFQVAPVLHAFAPPLMSSRVAPQPHLRLYRRWIVESPRFTHPSAVPVVKASGCPAAYHLRYRRRSVSRFPRILHLPAPTDSVPRVAPVHAPSGLPSSNLRVSPNLLLWPAAGLTS